MTSDRDGDENAAVGPDSELSTPRGSTDETDLEAEWAGVPDTPDLERHFGYEWIPFEVFGAEERADQLMILPTDKELLKRDAYLVADPDCIEDLNGWQ